MYDEIPYFAMLVVGQAGAGKTTYCRAMGRYLNKIKHPVILVNLDPDGNPDIISKEYDISITDIITMKEISKKYSLGPNGAMIKCFSILLENLDKFKDSIEDLLYSARMAKESIVQNIASANDNRHKFPYIIFDCPGQLELYTHDKSIAKFINYMTKENYKFILLQIIDSITCISIDTYLAALLAGVSTMLNIELPCINVLSKIDILKDMGFQDNSIEPYLSPNYDFIKMMLSKDSSKYYKLLLNAAELIDDIPLISCKTLSITDQDSLTELLNEISNVTGKTYYENYFAHCQFTK